MKPTSTDITPLIAQAASAVRRRDAETLTALMQQITGHDPVAWGSIIGFGHCHYRYPTGTEGDIPQLGFAPRRPASTIYLADGADAHRDALAILGPHTTGAGCLYIKNLDDVDLDVLTGILTRSYAWTAAGGSEQMVITVTE